MPGARRYLLAAALLSSSCLAQFPSENERLMAAARLWVTIEYFHPYLAYRDIDWDNALVSAIPGIRASTNTAEYRAAVSGMLEQLHDVDTYVITEDKPLPPAQPFAGILQLRTVHTATAGAFLVGSTPAPVDHIIIDLSGFRTVVRLSEPFTNLPAPRTATADPHFADPYPNAELRLLAAIKTWGAIHYFFAYKDLMDEDWDDVFSSYLSKFIDARDATDYNLVFADLLTHLTDTNTASHSKGLDAYFGEVPVGLRIRLLDKYPIVADVLDATVDVHPGDVLKRIGNESVTDRFRRFVQYVPASTPQRSGYDTVQRVTSGVVGSEVELSIENAQGDAHMVKMTRKSDLPARQRTADAVRVLPGNVGYLDLEALSVADAESALLRLKDTKAIVFDLRAPEAPGAVVIASHLASPASAAAALVTTPVALHPDVPTNGIATQTASTFVVQTLPAARQPLYKGKTVALIDERTIGEAEYAGLLFEAANKTEFVGAPSAGADSSIASLDVPGGITITYSTQDIRHGNGGKLQRLGLQPNVTAPTTAKGLRAGKDEPLEAALAVLAH